MPVVRLDELGIGDTFKKIMMPAPHTTECMTVYEHHSTWEIEIINDDWYGCRSVCGHKEGIQFNPGTIVWAEVSNAS